MSQHQIRRAHMAARSRNRRPSSGRRPLLSARRFTHAETFLCFCATRDHATDESAPCSAGRASHTSVPHPDPQPATMFAKPGRTSPVLVALTTALAAVPARRVLAETADTLPGAADGIVRPLPTPRSRARVVPAVCLLISPLKPCPFRHPALCTRASSPEASVVLRSAPPPAISDDRAPLQIGRKLMQAGEEDNEGNELSLIHI